MKDRSLWVFVAVAALMLAAAYWWRNQVPPSTPATVVVSTATKPSVTPPATTPPMMATPTVPAAPAIASAAVAEKKTKPEVPIQDGKTIDFSTGVAVVKDDARQKALIDKAVTDMDSALQSVSFAPSAELKSESTPTPPKP